jgi:hypothetical protein
MLSARTSDPDHVSGGPTADSLARREAESRVQLRCIAKRRGAPLTRSPNAQSSGSGAAETTEPSKFDRSRGRKPEMRAKFARTEQRVSEGASNRGATTTTIIWRS